MFDMCTVLYWLSNREKTRNWAANNCEQIIFLGDGKVKYFYGKEELRFHKKCRLYIESKAIPAYKRLMEVASEGLPRTTFDVLPPCHTYVRIYQSHRQLTRRPWFAIGPQMYSQVTMMKITFSKLLSFVTIVLAACTYFQHILVVYVTAT